MQEDEIHTDKDQDKSASATDASRRRNDSIHMKILVPSGAVGAIIGKGGEAIAQVQCETGAKIKLSKPNDFYPGTMERVCLIQGTLDGVTRMHNYIMDRMLEKPECAGTGLILGSSGRQVIGPTGQTSTGSTTGVMSSAAGVVVSCDASGSHSMDPMPVNLGSWPVVPSGSRLPWGRHQQVKILVPNCTAGLVIGKVGSYVKEIKDRTGAFIQISQKSKEVNLLERCITIAGEPDQCRAAVALVLAKIAEDPQSTSCPTISYSRVQGPVASAYPTGSPFADPTFPRFLHAPANAAVAASQSAAAAAHSAGHPTESILSDHHYLAPYMQAALLQAINLNRQGLYPQHATSAHGQPRFVTASPTSPMQASVGQSVQQSIASSLAEAGNMGASHGAGGLYAALGPPHASPGAGVSQAAYLNAQAGLWAAAGLEPAAAAAWAAAAAAAAAQAGTDAQLGVAQTGQQPQTGPSAYDMQAYTTPLNFAYYQTGQPVFTPMGSRHPSDTFPTAAASADIYHQHHHHPNAGPYETVGGGIPLQAAFPNHHQHQHHQSAAGPLRVTSPIGSSGPMGSTMYTMAVHAPSVGPASMAPSKLLGSPQSSVAMQMSSSMGFTPVSSSNFPLDPVMMSNEPTHHHQQPLTDSCSDSSNFSRPPVIVKRPEVVAQRTTIVAKPTMGRDATEIPSQSTIDVIPTFLTSDSQGSGDTPATLTAVLPISTALTSNLQAETPTATAAILSSIVVDRQSSVSTSSGQSSHSTSHPISSGSDRHVGETTTQAMGSTTPPSTFSEESPARRSSPAIGKKVVNGQTASASPTPNGMKK